MLRYDIESLTCAIALPETHIAYKTELKTKTSEHSESALSEVR